MRLSEQLDTALSFYPPDDDGMIIRVVRLTNESNPGQEMSGVLPVLVIGHEGMDRQSWRRWIRENSVAHYGPAMAEKFLSNGFDFKELDPTRPFGRSLRYKGGWKSEAGGHWSLDRALFLMTLCEKWPSIYNLIATDLAEQDMTLREFISRVSQFPSPAEIGEGRSVTLGDIIGRHVVMSPSY